MKGGRAKVNIKDIESLSFDEEPVTKEELNESEFLTTMTMSALMVLFETQNSII